MYEHITRTEAAKILNCCPSTVKRALIDTGKIQEITISTRKKFLFRKEVEELLLPNKEKNCS